MNQKKLYWSAVFFFLIVKWMWISLPVIAMGTPRLGDDALAYLWVGASSVVTPQNRLPAINDIIGFRNLEDFPGDGLDFARARTTMRTTGISASPLAILMGAVLNSGLDLKQTFALFEALIALALALSVAYFLRSFFGYGGASLALMMLTFVILPNQGIHYLIPSVLALSLAFLLWSVILKKKQLFGVKFLLSLILVLIHPIGQVYLLIACALAIGNSWWGRKSSRDTVLDICALFTGAVTCYCINYLSGAKLPPTNGMGGVSFVSVEENIIGLVDFLKVLLITQPLVSVVSLFGFIIVLLAPKKDIHVSLIITLLLGAFFTATVINLPGYPAELSSRILVALVIVSLGVAGQALFEKLPIVGIQSYWVVVGVGMMMLTQLPLFYTSFFSNLNNRYQLLNERILRSELASLPSDATILWTDSDTQMMTALLLGAGKYHFIPFSMLKGTLSLHSSLKSAKNLYITANYPERLNGLSTIGRKSLEKRYYGYGFNVFKRLLLVSEGRSIDNFYFRISDVSLDDISVTSDNKNAPCNVESVNIDGDPGTWVSVSNCIKSSFVVIATTNNNLKITGLSFNYPKNLKRWPWGSSGFRLRAEPIDSSNEAAELRFDWQYLFGNSTAEQLLNNLKELEVVTDLGGVIWLHTR